MLLTIVATTMRLQVAQGIDAEPALKERVRDAEQRMQQAITRSAWDMTVLKQHSAPCGRQPFIFKLIAFAAWVLWEGLLKLPSLPLIFWSNDRDLTVKTVLTKTMCCAAATSSYYSMSAPLIECILDL